MTDAIKAIQKFMDVANNTNLTEYVPDSAGEESLGHYAIARRAFLDSVRDFRQVLKDAEG